MPIKCKDELMREAHPGLQDLWEQYLTMYKLLDDGSISEKPTAEELLEKIRRRGRALNQTSVSISDQLKEMKGIIS